MMIRPRHALIALAFCLAAGGPASAETDLFSRRAFEGVVDLRTAVADGPPSFLDGGAGRGRYGGDTTGGARIRPSLAEAALVWKPQLTWAVGGVLDVEYQDGQEHAADVSEAYLTFRPTPSRGARYSARLGYFYPPISLEHEGAAWSVANSITPSAVNSWVGEEVKVVGAEVKVTRALGGQEFSATGALFGYNDTAGTLLSFRGWGLHDLKATAAGDLRLPPLDPYMAQRQPQFTSPNLELDRRIGWYARLDWRPPGPAAFNAFHYDNNGDMIAANADLQWAWATRFWNFGASLDLDEDTRLLSQVMTGEAMMGYPNGRSVWINLGFTAAYLLATHTDGRSAFTGRVDYFETRDRNFRPATDPAEDDRGEQGWALTGAYRYQVNPHAQLRLEALHVKGDRPSLAEMALKPRQSRTLLQSSLRLSF